MRKTAGSTLSTILRQSFLARHCDVRVRRERQTKDPIVSRSELQRTLVLYPDAVSIAGHGIVAFTGLELVVPDLRMYTVFRKPIERCASDYQFRVQRGGLKKSFAEWIKRPYARNHQTRKLAADGKAASAIQTLGEKLGFVGLTERFHESLVMFRHWSEMPELDLRYRSKNVAQDNSIKKQLLRDTTSRRLLEDANREDLQLYAFAYDAFLEQRREYGPSLASDVEAFETTNEPMAKYPRQIPAMLKRELIYKLTAGPLLSDRENPRFHMPVRRAA